MKCATKILLAALALLTPMMALAQDKPTPGTAGPAHFYHLVFQVQEADATGKVTNSRVYATSAATEAIGRTPGEIKTGTKIPLRTSDHVLNYIDVGVNVQIQNLIEDGSKLQLLVKAEISSLAPAPESGADSPIIRQNTWNAVVQVPVGKPTIIFSSDNLESKGKTQVELTATRME